MFFMTELKLLRMDPILPRSTLSTDAAGAATGGVTCATGCSVATDGSDFAGTGVDTSGWVGRSTRSSTEKKNLAVRESLDAIRYALYVMKQDSESYVIFIIRQHSYFSYCFSSSADNL